MTDMDNLGTHTIYINLLNEGSPCCRPTQGIWVSEMTYRVLPTENYDPDDEHWEFPPGSVVECRQERRIIDGESIQITIAVRAIQPRAE